MLICPAKIFDIPEIMAVEHNAFIPEIQEKQKIFEQRLSVFPEGFFVLQDTSDEVILRNKKALTVGYFCSELWGEIAGDEFFTLGHSPKKTHRSDGTVLYISSFAILSSWRGSGNGEHFFCESVRSICGAFPQIQTVVLLVSTDWKGAQHIYTKSGFKTVRILKGFFPSLQEESGRSDGILMKCDASAFRKTE